MTPTAGSCPRSAPGRVLGVEDGTLMLNSFGEDWHIDLKKAKWDGYVVKAAAALQ